jgi:hypothetical protein
MRPSVVAALALVFALSACTIREETFAPRDEESNNGLSLAAPGDLNTPAEGDNATCPGGLAQGSDIQVYRDGTQDLFCN